MCEFISVCFCFYLCVHNSIRNETCCDRIVRNFLLRKHWREMLDSMKTSKVSLSLSSLSYPQLMQKIPFSPSLCIIHFICLSPLTLPLRRDYTYAFGMSLSAKLLSRRECMYRDFSLPSKSLSLSLPFPLPSHALSTSQHFLRPLEDSLFEKKPLLTSDQIAAIFLQIGLFLSLLFIIYPFFSFSF